MEEKNKPLFVPINVRRRKEIVEGFGKSELQKTICITGIGLGIGIFIFVVFSVPPFFIMFVPLVFMAAAIVFLRKDKTNTNMIDLIMEYKKFNKSQKKYEYKYHNIHERKGDHLDGKK